MAARARGLNLLQKDVLGRGAVAGRLQTEGGYSEGKKGGRKEAGRYIGCGRLRKEGSLMP